MNTILKEAVTTVITDRLVTRDLGIEPLFEVLQ